MRGHHTPHSLSFSHTKNMGRASTIHAPRARATSILFTSPHMTRQPPPLFFFFS